MEIIKETIEDNKELGQEQKDKLAKKIAANFTQWDEDRNAQIDTAREIMQETYLNQPSKGYTGELAWKSDVKLNGLYNVKRAKKSIIWREMWAQTNQMFEVRGTNDQTEKLAKAQKAAISNALEKMNIGKQYDNGVDNLYDIGEIIFKTDWVIKKKVVKRQNKSLGFILSSIIPNMFGAGYSQVEMKDVEIPTYENARVESISPFMFVFDHTRYKLHDKDSWASCMKIYKRFDTLDNIKNNKLYDITPEMLEDLKADDKESDTEENTELIDLRDKDQYSGQVSILFAHGDFKVNGKLYKNYVAEVLGGKYLIRFEENPLYINPFILCALEYDPITKRGISPLKAVKDMILEEEKLTNVAFDVQKLTANPPCWSPEKLIDHAMLDKNGQLILSPGAVYEYKEGFEGKRPDPIQVSANGIADLLGLLGQKISDVSSTNSMSFGNIEDSKRTATELSLADKGSTAQSSKELDIINQDLTMPMIENVAELLAMFKDGAEFVYFQEKGKNIEYKITNEIRQAQYEYFYEDRNAMHDRKSKFQELYQLFQGVAQNPELFKLINWKEVITTAVEIIEFDNSDKFFNGETPVDQFIEQLKQIPQDLQQPAVQMLSQNLQQMVQQYQQQQQQAQMQQEANNQVQMDMMRQQARANAEQEMMEVM